MDTRALASHARLLAERSFAVPLGTQQEVAALLGAAGARVRACAGSEDVQAAGGEVLVLPRGRTAPAGVPWTDAARILVSRELRCAVLMLMGGLQACSRGTALQLSFLRYCVVSLLLADKTQ